MPDQDALDLNTATAAATAQAIRSGAISALEACDAAIARIERLDGPINAVVVRDFDRARTAAKAIDTAGARGDRRPLLGVPMTVKESNDVAGLPTTWGMPVFKDLPVPQDGVAVARLKAAGAVVLGKTNVPVGLADWQATNPIYGRTVNPHNHACSPGGSSGGAAAAVACGMVPLELGSDIGGSIRVPAHMCGIFGHKPTYGIIPLKGHGFPGTDCVDVLLAVVGPLARSADDLATALDVMAGPLDSVAYRLELPPPRHAALRDHRVLVLDAHPSVATGASVRDATNGLAQALERAGVHVTRSVESLPDLAAAHRAYMAMLTTIMSRGTPDARPADAHAWMGLEDEQMRLARQWRAVFAEVDVVLAPTFGVPAFAHEDNPDMNTRTLLVDGATTSSTDQLAWPGLATYPGLPATVAPIGKAKDGLPIGVQIVANLYEDRTALAFASLLQQEGLAQSG